MNRKILILRIFTRKTVILRKILRIRLILRIRIFVNTGPGHYVYGYFKLSIICGYVEHDQSASNLCFFHKISSFTKGMKSLAV